MCRINKFIKSNQSNKLTAISNRLKEVKNNFSHLHNPLFEDFKSEIAQLNFNIDGSNDTNDNIEESLSEFVNIHLEIVTKLNNEYESIIKAKQETDKNKSELTMLIDQKKTQFESEFQSKMQQLQDHKVSLKKAEKQMLQQRGLRK